jgi:hypothetical protein
MSLANLVGGRDGSPSKYFRLGNIEATAIIIHGCQFVHVQYPSDTPWHQKKIIPCMVRIQKEGSSESEHYLIWSIGGDVVAWWRHYSGVSDAETDLT